MWDGGGRLDAAGLPVTVDAESVEQATAQFREFRRSAVAGSRARHDELLGDRRPVDPGLAAEQDDPVGELERLVDVVRHEKNRGRCGGMHVEEKILHLEPGQRVERSERFVEEQDARVPGKCPCEGCPLRHSAGDLTRPVAREVAETDEVDQPLDPGSTIRPGGAARQAERDVVGDAPPGQKPRLLEPYGGAAVEAGDRGTVDEHPSGRGVIEAARDAQKGRLPTAAGAEDREHLAGFHGDRHIAEDGAGCAAFAGEGPANGREFDREGGIRRPRHN